MLELVLFNLFIKDLELGVTNKVTIYVLYMTNCSGWENPELD